MSEAGTKKYRCVIVGGAPINDYGRMREYLMPSDFFIYCDAGLSHREGLFAEPDLIVGDFDSFEESLLPGGEDAPETVKLSPAKDDTDTGHAVSEALRRGFRDFLLLGVLGRRIDHSLANIYLLYRLSVLGCGALMADDFGEYRMLLAGETVYLDDTYPFFSLVNITGLARGVDIKNARFPLQNAEITQEAADLGISNEVLPGEKAAISLREGALLLARISRG